MAIKPPKASIQTEPVHDVHNCGQTAIDTANIEDLLADSLLESIDWTKVKSLMIEKAQAKFWQWITAAAPATVYGLNEVEAIAIGSSEAINEHI